MVTSEQYRGIGMTSQRTRERLIRRLRERGIRDEAVLQVMSQTPRHLFVDEALASRSYEDTALPIGFGQTISQPYIVARMTEAVLSRGTVAKVLEIGTGSGYQCAILAQLVESVYSVERISDLLDRCRRLFYQLRLNNIHLKHADGTLGWPEAAPFDAILATAAPKQIPGALLQQLSPDGGRLLIPVGGDGAQALHQITRQGNEYEQEVLESVSFVPMLSGAD